MISRCDWALSAYKAQRLAQSLPFPGARGSTLVHVGPVDAPITRAALNEAVEAAVEQGATAVDCTGFESEIGLIPQATDDAAAKGVRLALRYIPKDVFDKRAVVKGQVVFYDVAYLEVSPR